MFRRQLPSAFRPAASFRASLTDSIVPQSARRFSATPSYGISAVFAETENPVLNETLRTIQEKIILPAYLPEKQRKRVFNIKMTSQLEQNPVVIELEGLEHKFTTINEFKDVPNSKKIFHQALQEMKTREEWENLGTLLAGYQKAGIKLQLKHYASAVRRAGQNGNIFTAIECAKQAQKTGLRLRHIELVTQMLVQINRKIVNSNGDAEQTAQAFKWSKIVLDLLQRPEHMTPNLLVKRLYMSPIVRSLLLFAEASAVQAKQMAGEPIEADLKSLSENTALLPALWDIHDVNNIANISDLVTLREEGSATHYVTMLVQSIRGLALAREMVGSSALELQRGEEALSLHLRDFATEAGKRPNELRWIQEYEEVIGQKPDWPVAPASASS